MADGGPVLPSASNPSSTASLHAWPAVVQAGPRSRAGKDLTQHRRPASTWCPRPRA